MADSVPLNSDWSEGMNREIKVLGKNMSRLAFRGRLIMTKSGGKMSGIVVVYPGGAHELLPVAVADGRVLQLGDRLE